MRKLILAVFLIGCGGSLPPGETTTTWAVTLGNDAVPVCDGSMTLSPIASEDTSVAKSEGTWSCGTFGQRAHMQVRIADNRTFLDLETNPGFLNGVRGTSYDDGSILGGILLDGVSVAFTAYRQ